jgi:hypothetical protein
MGNFVAPSMLNEVQRRPHRPAFQQHRPVAGGDRATRAVEMMPICAK